MRKIKKIQNKGGIASSPEQRYLFKNNAMTKFQNQNFLRKTESDALLIK